MRRHRQSPLPRRQRKSSPRAARCRSICHASASSMKRRRRALAVVAGYASWARISPKRWKVIQRVREKFSCPNCEAISQAPAPFHPIARGRAGPQLLAQILFSKYRAHLPLNRQSEIYAGEGIDISVSTLADWVGAAAATLMPLVETIRDHVFAAERIHADDTPVLVLAKGKTKTGRLWTYVRDDRPFGGQAPPAALYFYSPDRGGKHPRAHLQGWTGICQADAYAGYNELYEPGRKPAPIIEAGCWSHARRKFY
ncbi:MAG TPA: IS66 family transposase [Afifellaceae bacterium]|nr:IS66 family transposase [Afifellaceae bacterium]